MKKPVLIAMGATLVAVVVATLMWRELRSERLQNDALAARIAALESGQAVSVEAGAGQVAAWPDAASSRASDPEAAAVTPAERAGAGFGAGAAAGAVDDASSQPESLLRDDSKPSSSEAPAAQLLNGQAGEFAMAMMRQMLLQQYPDMDRELGITRAEADRFMELLIRQQEESATESLAMLMGGGAQGGGSMQEMQRKLVETEQANHAEQVAMLGSRYPRWEEYQGLAAARTEVTQLRTTLANSGSPLSDAQAAALESSFAAEQVRTLRTEREWMTSPAAADSPNMMMEQMQRVIDSRQQLIDAAAGVLSSAQMDAYRRQADQQVAVMRATMGMLGVQPSGGQAPAPVGPY